LNPKLVNFEWEHLDKLDFRDYDLMGFNSVVNSKEQLQVYIDSGIAFSGIVGDKVIMIGGVCVGNPKVGFGWVLTSDLAKEYKVFFHKACLGVIDEGIKVFGLHRVETTIMEGHEVSRKWAERIGFEEEGLMRKYDMSGNNYYLYARIL